MLGTLLTTGKIFETIMLVCFGCSWPISILKSWRSKFVRGKSVIFMVLILLGYIAGTTNKLLRAAHTDEIPEFTTWLYFINAVLVTIDLTLYYKYRHNHEPVTKDLARDIAEMIEDKTSQTD